MTWNIAVTDETECLVKPSQGTSSILYLKLLSKQHFVTLQQPTCQKKAPQRCVSDNEWTVWVR